MSLNPATIKSGATWTGAGGADLIFTPDGRAVANGLSLVVMADTNLVLRRSLTLKASLPALPVKVGDFAKLGRTSMVLKVPFLAADGKLYQQTVRIEQAFHSEYGTALKNGVINDAAALILDTDFANFWQASVLA